VFEAGKRPLLAAFARSERPLMSMGRSMPAGRQWAAFSEYYKFGLIEQVEKHFIQP